MSVFLSNENLVAVAMLCSCGPSGDKCPENHMWASRLFVIGIWLWYFVLSLSCVNICLFFLGSNDDAFLFLVHSVMKWILTVSHVLWATSRFTLIFFFHTPFGMFRLVFVLFQFVHFSSLAASWPVPSWCASNASFGAARYIGKRKGGGASPP